MPRNSIAEYDAFISYKREDEAHAIALQKRLEAERLVVFRDADGLTLARNVKDEVPEALQGSAAVVVLWSALTAASQWVVDEATYAWGAGKYLPLLVPGAKASVIPAKFRDYTAKRLEDILADPTRLIEEIERLKDRGAPGVRIHNKMPASGEHLIGREGELRLLDAAWASGETRVVVLDAMGGTGKTALINRFLENMAKDAWRGAERVYCWSFYSQGTDEKRQGDADGFFAEALEWFGYRGEPITSATKRGDTLAELINRRRTLLVLDGLEPLQFPAHSPGLEGALKDDGLRTMLRKLALQMNGLLIVTTRIPIPELKDKQPPAVERRGLNQLETRHGVTLLRMLGVKAAEKEIVEAVELLKGHALSLNLLGTYSKEILGGHLPVRAEIERLLASPEVSQDAYVMMRRYEILLEERAKETARGPEASAAGRQLALLYLIGLFDRPAEREALDALFAEPIEGLTDTLADLSPEQWKFAVAALRKLKLILPEGQPGEIDAHPLVREYFGARLKATRPEAFKAANLRLYEHYKLKDIPPAFHEPVRYGILALAGAHEAETFSRVIDTLIVGQFPAGMEYLLPPALRGIAPGGLRVALDSLDNHELNAALARAQPGAVKAMEPLFAAVAHGSAAGAWDAAFREVYWPRVNRGNKAFLTNMLGAYGADLSALAQFFEVPFALPSRSLAPFTQALVLGNVAYALRALGRLTEAVPPLEEALRRAVANEDWRNADTAAGNLSEVRLTLGSVSDAVAAAREAVTYADSSALVFERLTMRTALADALHQAGMLAEAQRLFGEAEMMQAQDDMVHPMLYSLRGYLYCDLLLSKGGGADVRGRANQMFEWSKPTRILLDVALATLALGRAVLALGQADEARAKLEAAVDSLREAGSVDEFPRGLLARAKLHRVTGALDLAAADLNEVDDIAARSRMRLFATDALLERARLTLARGGRDAPDAATRLAAQAKALIEDTGSRRRIPDLALVMARIAAAKGDTANARTHLAEAQKWIDEGWGCHAAEHAEISELLAKPGSAAKSRPGFFSRLLGR